MKAPLIKEMLTNGDSVNQISKNLKVSRGYVGIIKACLKKGVASTFYQKQFLLRNPEIKNKNRRKNYAKGAIYDFRSRETYPDQDKELILKFPGTDRELAKIINRSVKAIQVKRVRIRRESGLIVEDV